MRLLFPAKLLAAILLFLTNTGAMAQEKNTTDTTQIFDHFFLPALEIGYVSNSSNELLNSLMIKTSVEYRFRTTRGPFVRLNYDTYDARYSLPNISNTTNILNGTAFFSDIIGGAGYRLGSAKFRAFALAQVGLKFYDYPSATTTNNTIEINLDNKRANTYRLTFGAEYYFNEKSALTVELLYGQVLSSEHFWKSGNSILGLSIGFATSLN